MRKIRELSRNFTQLKAQHIYREYNKEVVLLSKAALTLEDDGLYYAEFKDGQTEIFDTLDIAFLHSFNG